MQVADLDLCLTLSTCDVAREGTWHGCTSNKLFTSNATSESWCLCFSGFKFTGSTGCRWEGEVFHFKRTNGEWMKACVWVWCKLHHSMQRRIGRADGISSRVTRSCISWNKSKFSSAMKESPVTLLLGHKWKYHQKQITLQSESIEFTWVSRRDGEREREREEGKPGTKMQFQLCLSYTKHLLTQIHFVIQWITLA